MGLPRTKPCAPQCRYKPPPEVGVQRVAGVVVDGRRPGSQEGISGMQVSSFARELKCACQRCSVTCCTPMGFARQSS